MPIIDGVMLHLPQNQHRKEGENCAKSGLQLFKQTVVLN